ncbi:MAG: carbon monoxide dehydrogenase subunit G [Candidatus Eremiobacteraeota bacterium]|nr:carbon monoxide dehydrogenase subunit G [Candidatus Eremiobacteraeota bacterium]
MKVHYSGSEQIAASTDAAYSFMTTPEKVAQCLPDVVSTDVKDATHFTSVVKVGVGPVRGNFTFDVTLEPKPDAKQVSVNIHGGGLGSVVDQVALATFKDSSGGATQLDWSSDATISGPVATVGGRILDAQAKRIIEYVFSQVRERLTGAAPAAT